MTRTKERQLNVIFGTSDVDAVREIVEESVAPLRFGIDVIEGECLPSLIQRSAETNGFENGERMLYDTIGPWSMGQVVTRDPEMADRTLAQLLRVDEGIIGGLRFAKEQRWGRDTVVDYLGSETCLRDIHLSHVPVSAAGLQEADYIRLSNLQKRVPFCTRTSTMLSPYCTHPDCGRPLKWRTLQKLQICSTCRRDLRRGFAIPVPSDVLSDCVVMTSLLDPRADDREEILDQLHPDLRQLNTGHLFDLGWRLSFAFANVTRHRKNGVQMQSEDLIRHLAASSEILATWPECIPDQIKAFIDRNGAGEAPKLLAKLRLISFGRSAPKPIRELFDKTDHNLRGKSSLRLLTETLDDSLMGEDVHVFLGLCNQSVIALRNSGALKPIIVTGDVRKFSIYKTSDVQKLKEKLAVRVPIGTAAEQLGIPWSGMEQLYAMGHVHQGATIKIDKAFDTPSVSRPSMDELISRLADAAGHQTWSETTLLPVLLRALGGREKPWGPIIAALLGGHIPFAWSAEGEAPKAMPATKIAQAIVVPTACMEHLCSIGFDDTRLKPSHKTKWLTSRDAAVLLNLSPNALIAARKNELKSFSDGTKLNREKLLAFSRKCISPAEASWRWFDGQRLKWNIVHNQSAFTRFGESGWCRDEVERFFENRQSRRLPKSQLGNGNAAQLQL